MCIMLSRSCTYNINDIYNLHVISEVEVAIQQVSDSTEQIRLFLQSGNVYDVVICNID